LRGGSWNLPLWHSRVTTRAQYELAARSANLGFRIALEPAKDQFDIKSLKSAVKKMSQRNSSVKSCNFKINDFYFKMIFVEGGTFTMGCTSDPERCFDNEEPVHSVTLSDFYVGEFQVTQQLWSKVMGTAVSEQRDLGNPEWELCGEGDYYPIYYITYEECEMFCEKLNQLLHKQLPEGYKFNLPTEAQWEYAARGGKKSKNYTYSGSNIINKVAWYGENCKEQLHETGAKTKNELGIYDMSGNVWEWCRDWFSGDYYLHTSFTNPTGPDQGYYHVLRGGSWRSAAQGCRVSCRYRSAPNERGDNYGVRVALVKD
jgi:formylglycine-generating enzyme required for sulfatase activity